MNARERIWDPKVKFDVVILKYSHQKPDIESDLWPYHFLEIIWDLLVSGLFIIGNLYCVEEHCKTITFASYFSFAEEPTAISSYFMINTC